jgi:hypothetical protein
VTSAFYVNLAVLAASYRGAYADATDLTGIVALNDH